MKDIVEFFWNRYHRGIQMGKPYDLQATEWLDAYKNTLSKNKNDEFDKIWRAFEQELQDFRDGKKGAKAPLERSFK